MPLNDKSRFATDRSQDNIFYRPPIQLDCTMTQTLVTERAFSESPLVIGDVGVRLGFDRSWDIFADQCLQVGFEPDEEECARINAEYAERESQRLPRERVESVALWDHVGTKILYITRDPNSASCFLPNDAFFQRLPDSSQIKVVKTQEIQTTTLDDYHQRNKIDFDVLKLDVQGGELHVLKGAIRQLHDSVLAVVMEVAFVELYLGQPLFAEIDQFMRAQGFNLFDLDIRRWRRRPLPNTFNEIRLGQAIYADALYLKDLVEYPNLPADIDTKRLELLKLAALAEYFSLPDYAIEILLFAQRLRLIGQTEKNRLVDMVNANRIIRRYSRTELRPNEK